MADSVTPIFEFILPEIGASQSTWGSKLNTNWSDIDGLLAVNTASYATAAIVATINVPSMVDALTTDGFAIPGDSGDATYTRAVSEPVSSAKIQSLDEAWWEAAPEMGAFKLEILGDSPTVADITLLMQDAIDKDYAVTVSRRYTLASGISLVLGAGENLVLRGITPEAEFFRGAASAEDDFRVQLLVSSNTGAAAGSVIIEGMTFNGNTANNSVPASPFDYEHSHEVQVLCGTGSTIEQVIFSNNRLIEPIAAGINIPGINLEFDTGVNLLEVSNLYTVSRSRRRSDIEVTGLLPEIYVSNCDITTMDYEPNLAVTTGKTSYHVTNTRVSNDRIFSGGFASTDFGDGSIDKDNLELFIDNCYLYNLVISGLSGRISNCTVYLTKDSGNEGRINFVSGRFVFDNCTLSIPSNGAGAVIGINIIWNDDQATLGGFIEFKSCHLGVLDDSTSTLTGFAIPAASAQAAALLGKTHIWLDGCTFDLRFEKLINVFRTGKVILSNNRFSCRAQAWNMENSGTFVSEIDEYSNSYVDVDSDLNGELISFGTTIGNSTIRMASNFPSVAFDQTNSGWEMGTFHNNRTIEVSTAPVGAGIKGDRAILNPPVAGAAYEWVCTVSSESVATWKVASTLAA